MEDTGDASRLDAGRHVTRRKRSGTRDEIFNRWSVAFVVSDISIIRAEIDGISLW